MESLHFSPFLKIILLRNESNWIILCIIDCNIRI